MTTTGRALLLAVLFLTLGSLGGYRVATWKAEAAAAKVAKEQADRDAKAARELADLTTKYRDAEHAHTVEVEALRAEFQRHEDEARSADAAAIADLKSGARRMRLQVASCKAAGPAAPGPAPGGSDGAATAELAPATAAALYGIAGDGDTAIRKLNLLQTWAVSAVKLCNGVRP